MYIKTLWIATTIIEIEYIIHKLVEEKGMKKINPIEKEEEQTKKLSKFRTQNKTVYINPDTSLNTYKVNSSIKYKETFRLTKKKT